MTTTTDPATPAASAATAATAELKPGARFRRVGGALSLLGAGTLIFASLAMIPYENENHAQYLQTGVDHQTNILWAAVVLHFGYLLLVPSAFWRSGTWPGATGGARSSPPPASSAWP